MDVPAHEIVNALENDAQLDFKQITAKTLRKGICPACGKRELYISTQQPYQLKCPRDNNCGYEESTRSRYPHLWEDLSSRVPATDEDPNATARAFLNNRGFDTGRLTGMYTQEIRKIKIKSGESIPCDVVRFQLWDGHYWDRLLNEKDVRTVGDKARISFGLTYAGKCWTPPRFELKAGDRCFITEGIFHSLAFMFAGENAAAAISSTNFPWELVKAHKGKNITWVIAYDDDPAGRKWAKKYRKQLLDKGEKVQIALTGSADDWDDFHKRGEMTPQFITDSIWRGDMFSAETVAKKAYFHYLKYKRGNHILEHGNRLYQVYVKTDNLNTDIQQKVEGVNQTDIEDSDEELSKDAATEKAFLESSEGFQLFASHLKTVQISNCNPMFKYCERDKLTGDIAYYFEVLTAKNGAMQAAFSGSAIESPSSFNKALLNKAAGATFDGDAKQLKTIRENWFDHGIELVDTVPFIGYDKNSGIYVFPEFAFYQGRPLKINRYGYFTQDKHRVKTSFKSIHLEEGEGFSGEWLDNFLKTFAWGGLTVLAFWLGSLFAEQIRARHASYPFLEMSGMPGTGKSTLLELLWKSCGRDDYEGFDPSKASFAARARAFIQTANLPVVLIEGDRNKDAKKGGFDYNELKTAYNGRAVRSMGAFNNGNETIEPPFRGSIIIAQNEEVDADAAVLERIVHLEFTKKHFTPETKHLSQQFERMKVKELAGFLRAALEKETAILNTFEEKFALLELQYTDNGKLKNGRIIKNHAMVAAFGYSLQHLFPAMKKNDRMDKLAMFIEKRGMEREKRLISDHPLVCQFWEVFELLENKDSGDGGNTSVNHSKADETIAINFGHLYQVANQYRFNLPPQNEVKKLLRSGTTYKFRASNKATSSAVFDGKTYKCWIFENPNFKGKGSKAA